MRDHGARQARLFYCRLSDPSASSPDPPRSAAESAPARLQAHDGLHRPGRRHLIVSRYPDAKSDTRDPRPRQQRIAIEVGPGNRVGVFSFSVQQHTVGFICSHSPAASKRLIFYRFLMAGLERSISSRFKRLRVQNSSHDWPSLGPQLTDFEYMDRCSKPDQKPEEYPTVTCAALCVSPCFLPYVIARKTRDPLF